MAAAALTLSIAAPNYIEGAVQLNAAGPQAEQTLLPINDVDPLAPARNLTPADVVRITLEGLQHNDTPYQDAGIGKAFVFSSPANQLNSGPLANFREMLHGNGYSPMINHLSARFVEVDVYEREAHVPVVVVSQRGDRYGFTFHLTLQDGGSYDGCWMIEGVFPFYVMEDESEPLLVTA
jgi:hypothetical protein